MTQQLPVDHSPADHSPADHSPADHSPADHYDRDGYDYRAFWVGRTYEDAADHLAVKRLMGAQRFRRAADIGGGYGRLCLLLAEHADQVTLTDSSRVQLAAAADILRGTCIDARLMTADALGFAAESLDLVTMIRVMHHLPDPTREFAELARVLQPGGVAIIEVANADHMGRRLRRLITHEHASDGPVPIGTHRTSESISFVNHHLPVVIAQLAEAGLVLECKLSVSNLRSSLLKRHVPNRLLVAFEYAAQAPLARFDFGPSIYLKLRKTGGWTSSRAAA